MAIRWRSGAEVLGQILRRYGVDPAAVTSVEAAWRAFGEFLQVGVDGLDTDPDCDADGFIVSWGRYPWNDRRPSLPFVRQLTVADVGGQDPDRPQELWQMS